MKYWEVFREHNHYASSKWEHYIFIYEEILKKYVEKGKPVNVLEVGVQNGGSLEILEKYLPKGSKIFGVDICEKCSEIDFPENIQCYVGDASERNFWDNNLQDIKFDIIIDDGSHKYKDIINAFTFLFYEKLNGGGLYLVEDLHTSYMKGFGGGLRKKGSSVEYFKNLIDSLNINYAKKRPLFPSKEFEELKELNKHIKRISFYDSICTIEKYNSVLKESFSACYTGECFTVTEPWGRSEVISYKEKEERMSEVEKLFF